MKKTKLLPVAIALTLFASFTFWGCNPNNTDYPNYTEFVMQIDSIQHPSSILLGRNLNIKFYGKIGPDGCYTFSRFAPSLQGKNINITVYGKHSDATSCDTATSYLDGATLAVTQLDTGRYIIHVSQAEPPDIYDTVYVHIR